MSEVESLSDLPAWKAEKTTERYGDEYHRRSEPAGTALHHYADLGEREETLAEIECEVEEELARLDSDNESDENDV